MFDSPFDFLPIAIAVVAFVVARKAMNETALLRRRIDMIEAAATATVPPPLPTAVDAEPTLAPAGDRAEDQTATIADEPPNAGPPPLPPEATAPPPIPQAGPGFEERLGTRWVVWVGGLTLALGGFFMVRYSIEQGLLGPGVRTILGGLFALALLAAGDGPAARKVYLRSHRCRSPTSRRS
jgi:uncharacterized membrane protein